MGRLDYVTLVNKKDLDNPHRVIEELGNRFGWSDHTWFVDDKDNIRAYYSDAGEVESIIHENK